MSVSLARSLSPTPTTLLSLPLPFDLSVAWGDRCQSRSGLQLTTNGHEVKMSLESEHEAEFALTYYVLVYD